MDVLRRRWKRCRPLIPWGVSHEVTVAGVASFRIAHALGCLLASPNRRWTITLRPGVYRMAVECASGVDIVGPRDAVVVWDGPRDTINLNGADVRVSGITVRHVGADFVYALHCDAPGPGKVVLEGIHAQSDSKSAIGLGVAPGQSVIARRCHFERGSLGRVAEPVLAHNWPEGGHPAVQFFDCTVRPVPGTADAVWTDLQTEQVMRWDVLPQVWTPAAPVARLEDSHATTSQVR